MFKRILRSKTLQARARWILAILLVPPFIFFFHMWVGGRSVPGPGGTAGVVFGRQVPWETFQQEYWLIRQSLEAQAQGTIPEGAEPALRQQTWDRLILREEARRQVRVSNEELAQFIQRQPTFQKDGRFVPELYYQFVRGLGFTTQAYEARIRDDLRIQKLLESVNAQAHLTDEELKIAYANEHEQIRTTLILIEHAAFADQVRQTLSDEILREVYATHQQALQRPAKRTMAYIGMSLEEAQQPESPISQEEIQTYDEEHADEFMQADGTARPIEEVQEEIQRRIHEAHARTRLKNLTLDLEEDLEQGVQFEEIARIRQLPVYTVGPIERQTKDIPNGPTGSMLDAAFAVPLGKMTRVFETPRGVFVLRPVEELPASVPPFEEVKHEVEQRAVQERSREASHARARQVYEELVALRKTGLTFDEACLNLGLEPLRPSPFTRSGMVESLGDVPAVTGVLFNLKAGEFSGPLDVPRGFVIAFVEERLPVDEAQFERDKERFRQASLASKQQQHLAMWFESLRTQARLKSFLEETSQ